MSTVLTLEAVQAEFQQWRQCKAPGSRQVPFELRRKALALRGSVKISKLTQTLGINSSMINSWSNTENIKPPSIDQAPKFVPMPVESLPVNDASALCDDQSGQVQLSYRLNNGSQLSLQGNISPLQLAAFVNALDLHSGGVS